MPPRGWAPKASWTPQNNNILIVKMPRESVHWDSGEAENWGFGRGGGDPGEEEETLKMRYVCWRRRMSRGR